MSRYPHHCSVLLLTFACSIACEAESAAPAEAAPTLRRGQAPRSDVDHERTRASILSMLRAHHAEDLPTRADIEAHPGGAEALRWAAEHHALRGVRARALLTLASFPDEASLAILRRTLADPRAPASLRAASIRALAGWDLSARSDIRVLALEALRSDDVAVAVAAVEVLRHVPEVHDALAQRRTTAVSGPLQRALAPVSR